MISFAKANESINATFKTANELYNKEKFSEAIQSFESIVYQGRESADLYFNIANCYIRSGLTKTH